MDCKSSLHATVYISTSTKYPLHSRQTVRVLRLNLTTSCTPELPTSPCPNYLKPAILDRLPGRTKAYSPRRLKNTERTTTHPTLLSDMSNESGLEALISWCHTTPDWMMDRSVFGTWSIDTVCLYLSRMVTVMTKRGSLQTTRATMATMENRRGNVLVHMRVAPRHQDLTGSSRNISY